MTSMDRLDAVRLAMSTHFIYRARKDPQSVPTEADLVRLHDEHGRQESGEWEDLVDDLVCAAHPFVSEDGTWLRHHAGQTVVEEVGSTTSWPPPGTPGSRLRRSRTATTRWRGPSATP